MKTSALDQQRRRREHDYHVRRFCEEGQLCVDRESASGVLRLPGAGKP